jgi:hypothetical protein
MNEHTWLINEIVLVFFAHLTVKTSSATRSLARPAVPMAKLRGPSRTVQASGALPGNGARKRGCHTLAGHWTSEGGSRE